MKKTAAILFATVAAIGLSAPASAAEYIMKVAATETPLAATEAPIEDINVTASRLEPGTPVAVSGTVDEISGSGFTINSMAGPVKVSMANKYVMGKTGYLPAATSNFMVGDSVTAFGALRHGDVVGVKPQAILLHQAPSKAHLLIVNEPKLQSAHKLNMPIHAKATLRALQNTHREL